MSSKHHKNPFKPLLIAGTLLLLTAVVFDPMLRGFLMPDDASAVGGYSASDLLGQLDGDGNPVYTTNAVDNGEVTPNAQGFNGPTNVVLDAMHHRLFVADSGNNRVLVFNLNAFDRPLDHTADFVLGQPDFATTTAGTTAVKLSNPRAVSYDQVNDRLYVADTGNNRVLVFSTATIINGENAVFVLGQSLFITSTAATTQSGMRAPEGVSSEPLNNLLIVADTNNNRVLRFDTSALSDGMNANVVFGQTVFTSSTSATTATGVRGPTAVLGETNTDSAWVVDRGNNRVLQFDLFAASGPTALAVLGQPGFTSSVSATTADGMSQPAGVTIIEADDTTQRLFVSDAGNNRTLVFNIFGGFTNGAPAVDVYGQTAFTSSSCTTTSQTLCGPGGVDYNESLPTLFIADTNNNRVMIFGSSATPTPTPAGGSRREEVVGFFPDKIVVNNDESSTDSTSVLVDIYAHYSNTFTGTVDVLLSNVPDFSTTIPFRYTIPEQSGWPKTVAWDLCFGVPRSQCDPGQKSVYARFYVNTTAPQPAYTPLPTDN